MYKAGLILEGGAMRGVYTCGVLDYFIEKNIEFSHIYGVSAGAGHACSYMSKQKGRAFQANTGYLHGYNYTGLGSLVKTGSLFNMDLIYDWIPKNLYFDNKTFCENKAHFYAVVTSCETGEAEYIRVTDCQAQMQVIRASGSLPLISPPVELGGKLYFDGGISDSIPVAKSIADGNEKNVIVLTRSKDYRKTPERSAGIIKKKYKEYPALYEAVKERHNMYNRTLDLIDELEASGLVVVIRPKEHVSVKRADKNMKKLNSLYNQGYEDAKEAAEKFPGFFA